MTSLFLTITRSFSIYSLLTLLLAAPYFYPECSFGRIHSSTAIASLEQTSKAFRSVIETAGSAVVNIFVDTDNTITGQNTGDDQKNLFNDPFFNDIFQQDSGEAPSPAIKGHGSGFIIDKDGFILTNSHVVKNARSITVQLIDHRQFNATLIGLDLPSDVALLQIEADNLTPLPLGNSDQINIGDWAIVIGFPLMNTQSASIGIVSAIGLNNLGIHEYENFIQTDASIYPGNSGGPLINIYGEAIGINTAFSASLTGKLGMGFAIPINMAVDLARQLRKSGKVIRGWLGVGLKNEKNGKVTIVRVKKGSPAEKNGLQPGDILQTIDGAPLNGSFEFRNRLALNAPGSFITLGIKRNNEQINLKIRLGKRTSDAFSNDQQDE